MSNGDDILVRFGGETSGLEDSSKRAAESTEKVTESVSKLTPKMKELSDQVGNAAYNYGPWSGQSVEVAQVIGTTLVGALGAATVAFAALAAGAALAIGVITHSVVNLGVETGKLAAEFGQSVEDIGKLGGVAKVAGTDAATLGKSFQDLQKNIKDGDDDTKNALKAMGLGMDQVKGKNFPELLGIFADKFKNTGDSAYKTAAAVALFGEDMATKLLPVLNQGKEAVADFAGMAARAGTELSGAMTDKIAGTALAMAKVGTAFSELGESIKGVGLAIYDVFKPAIDGLILVFGDLIRNIASSVEWFSAAIREGGAMRAAFEVLSFSVKLVETALVGVVAAIQTFVISSTQAVSMVSNLFVGLAGVIVGMFKDMTANASAAFTAMIESAKMAWNGIGTGFVNLGQVISKALTGDFAGAGAAFGKMKADAAATAEGIGKSFNGPGLANTEAAFAKMTGAMSADFKSFQNGVITVANQTQNQLKAIWGDGANGAKAKPARQAGNPETPDEEGGKGANKANTDAVRAAMQEIEGEIQALKNGLAEKKLMYEQDVITKKITEAEKTELVRKATDEEYKAELALLQKMAAIEDMKASQKQAVLNKIAQLESRHRQEMMQLDNTALKASMQKWGDLFNTIGQSVSGSIMGMIKGTETLKQAGLKLSEALLNSFIQSGVKMVTNWAAGVAARMGLTATEKAADVSATAAAEAAKTSAVVAGAAARAGAEETSGLMSILTTIGNAIKSIFSSSAQTTAGVTAYMAPLIGPAAPAAGAAAGAATLSAAMGMMPLMDTGAWELKSDTVAGLHQGEMVIPQKGGIASEFRALLSGDSKLGGAGAAQQQRPIKLSFNISALDTRSGVEWVKQNIGTVATQLQKHLAVTPSVKLA